MKFPMKRTQPPTGNCHGIRKSPRPNKNEIWELAMSDEIDELPEEEGKVWARDVLNDTAFSGIS
jgi:hypothetical protein